MDSLPFPVFGKCASSSSVDEVVRQTSKVNVDPRSTICGHRWLGLCKRNYTFSGVFCSNLGEVSGTEIGFHTVDCFAVVVVSNASSLRFMFRLLSFSIDCSLFEVHYQL